MDGSLASRLSAAGLDPEAIENAQVAFETLKERFDEVTLQDRLELEALQLGVEVGELTYERRINATEGFYGTRWEGFEIVGRQRDDPVEIVEYNPAWPLQFDAWRRLLEDALDGAAVRIEHVGSTAVPGLAAKPVIDIEVSVTDLEDEASYVPAIEGVGVALRSRDAEHRYFRPAPGRPRDVQVHVCAAGSDWERDHLLFRDYLRAHEDIRDEYASLKRELAARFRDDRLAYTEAKGAFIQRVMDLAREWRA